jgi:hypothetical protein
MSRKRSGVVALSLDSFLDIVTNVVGVLILAAVVTVLSANDVTIATGATSLREAPRSTSSRILVQCKNERAYFVDEERTSEKLREALVSEPALDASTIPPLLTAVDVGDRNYRVRAENSPPGVTWVYQLREDADGDTIKELEGGRSRLARVLDKLAKESFVYFVVHDDSFEVFRAARDLAQRRGVATGWHPVEGDEPLRLSSAGSLGKRIQ